MTAKIRPFICQVWLALVTSGYHAAGPQKHGAKGRQIVFFTSTWRMCHREILSVRHRLPFRERAKPALLLGCLERALIRLDHSRGRHVSAFSTLWLEQSVLNYFTRTMCNSYSSGTSPALEHLFCFTLSHPISM